MPEKASIGLDYSHNNKFTLEASSYADFTQFLFTSGYKLGKIQAGFESVKKLEAYNMIILSTPNNVKLSEQDIEILEEYVRNGGGLLIVSSSGGDYTNRTNLNDLTQKFGFEFEEDEVYDSMNYINFQKRPLLNKFKPHVVTEQIKKIVYSSACSLNVHEFSEDEENIKVEVLVQGGLNCWRKKYNFSEDDWSEEDSPKIPLLVAGEYYKGRVVAFGNLSMFSSLGSEYGFSAFDNDILIANTLRYLTSGIVREGKVVTVNLNIDLFYWAQGVLRDQAWESVSDVINLSLKYLKDNYKSVIDQLRQEKEERMKRKKAYKKKKEEKEAASDEEKILEFVTERKREDLEDIMSAIEDISGEKYEIEVDIEEDLEPSEEEEIKLDQEGEVDEETTDIEKEIEKKIEEQLDEQTKELEDDLTHEIENEQIIIMGNAKEEVEKEIDSKIGEESVAKIEKALKESIGKDITKIKSNVMKKAKVEIMRKTEIIIETAKKEIRKISEENREKEKKNILKAANMKIKEERQNIIENAKKQMVENRKERIITIKERELKILKENQEFFDEIMAATDMFSGPILEEESYSEAEIEEFEKETSKNAIWKGNPTKQFKEWLKEKK